MTKEEHIDYGDIKNEKDKENKKGLGDLIVRGNETRVDMGIEYLAAAVALNVWYPTSLQHIRNNADYNERVEAAIKIVEKGTARYKEMEETLEKKIKPGKEYNTTALVKQPEPTKYLEQAKYLGQAHNSSEAAYAITNPFVVAAVGVLLLNGLRSIFLPKKVDYAISRVISSPVKWLGNAVYGGQKER